MLRRDLYEVANLRPNPAPRDDANRRSACARRVHHTGVSGWWERHWKAGRIDLEQYVAPDNSTEPERTQLAEVHAGRRGTVHRFLRLIGDQDLSAVSGRTDPIRRVHLD